MISPGGKIFFFKFFLIGSGSFNGTHHEKYQRCLRDMWTTQPNPFITIHGDPKNFVRFDSSKSSAYLINTDGINLTDMLIKWSKMEFFNPRANFFIFVNDTVTNQLFQILSKFYIVNVTVIGGDFRLYTYFPYKYENVGQPDTTPVYLGDCRSKIFTNELPKFWRNTTIKILTKCVLPYVDCSNGVSGLEIFIIKLLKNTLKFEINHVIDKSPIFGSAKKNGSYTSSFRFLDERIVDMGIGSFRSVGYNQYRDFDYTFNHMEDKLVWVVPKALPMVHWRRIVKIFDLKCWLLLTISILAMAKIFQIVTKIALEETHYFENYHSSLLSTFRLLLSGQLRRTPKRTIIRFILILWIYFCMNINITFNSNLIEAFFGNFYMFQINSFRDIIESDLGIGLTDDVLQILKQEPKSVFSKMKVEICPFGPSCLNRTAYQRILVCCWGERSIKNRIAMSGMTDVQGQPIVHLIDDHILFFYIMFYFVKGYPMVPQVSQTIIHLKSAGFVQNIYNKMDHTNKLWSLLSHREFQSKSLNFHKLQGPFYLLFIGWFIGILVFCFELMIKCIKSRKMFVINKM